MRKTRNGEIQPQTVLVNLKQLQEILGCGRTSAEKIALAAKSSVRIGRRHLYNMDKVKAFINEISE